MRHSPANALIIEEQAEKLRDMRISQCPNIHVPAPVFLPASDPAGPANSRPAAGKVPEKHREEAKGRKKGPEVPPSGGKAAAAAAVDGPGAAQPGGQRQRRQRQQKSQHPTFSRIQDENVFDQFGLQVLAEDL